MVAGRDRDYPDYQPTYPWGWLDRSALDAGCGFLCHFFWQFYSFLNASDLVYCDGTPHSLAPWPGRMIAGSSYKLAQPAVLHRVFTAWPRAYKERMIAMSRFVHPPVRGSGWIRAVAAPKLASAGRTPIHAPSIAPHGPPHATRIAAVLPALIPSERPALGYGRGQWRQR